MRGRLFRGFIALVTAYCVALTAILAAWAAYPVGDLPGGAWGPICGQTGLVDPGDRSGVPAKPTAADCLACVGSAGCNAPGIAPETRNWGMPPGAAINSRLEQQSGRLFLRKARSADHLPRAPPRRPA